MYLFQVSCSFFYWLGSKSVKGLNHIWMYMYWTIYHILIKKEYPIVVNLHQTTQLFLPLGQVPAPSLSNILSPNLIKCFFCCLKMDSIVLFGKIMCQNTCTGNLNILRGIIYCRILLYAAGKYILCMHLYVLLFKDVLGWWLWLVMEAERV